MVRAKFRCYVNTAEDNGDHVVKLRAEYGDGKGNEAWSKATPQGELSMRISNPNAFGRFEPGKDYYLDFSPA